MRSSLRALLLLALALAACAPAAPSTPATGAAVPAEQRDEKQSLRVGVGGVVANYTPMAATSPVHMFWPMYDNLTQFGPDFEVRPSVAERWDLSDDGKVWKFYLRRDVTWSNGDPLTADDVAFTILQNVQGAWPGRSFFGSVSNAVALDPATVEVTTRQPDMSILNGGPYLWLVPKKYFEQVGRDGFVAKPIGSGPYELVEFKVADSIHLKKRATAHPFRKAVLDEIIFKSVPDAIQRINGLRTGEIDFFAQAAFSAEQVDQLKAAGVTVIPHLTSVQAIGLPQGAYESRGTPLRDRRVRLALNYAVDKEAISKTILKGLAQPAGQYAIPGSLYWDPDARPIPYDPAQAKRLLAEAGYPNGFKLENGMDYNQSLQLPDIPLAIQANLRDVGVEFQPNPAELGLYSDKVYSRNNQTVGDLVSAGTGDGNGFFSGVRILYGCGKPAGGGPNSTHWCNPEWDRLLDAAYAERDVSKRIQLMRQANKLQRDDVSMIFLINQPTFNVHTSKVRGLVIPTALSFNYDTVYKVR